MKRMLKSALGGAALGYNVLASVYSMMQLWPGQGIALPWWGLLLASVSIASYLAYALLSHRQRRAELELLVAIISGLGLALTMAAHFRFGTAAGQAHAWAGGALISWFAWVKFCLAGHSDNN